MGCGHWECSNGYSCGYARFDTAVSHFNGAECILCIRTRGLHRLQSRWDFCCVCSMLCTSPLSHLDENNVMEEKGLFSPFSFPNKRFSAFLPWRLGLTHAKLEESRSCTPSYYGPTWRLQSWPLGCNGLTTYRNFRARGLSDSDTTWMPWMHWYRAAQAAIGVELHAFNLLQFSAYSKLTQASSAKSNKSEISGISE